MGAFMQLAQLVKAQCAGALREYTIFTQTVSIHTCAAGSCQLDVLLVFDNSESITSTNFASVSRGVCVNICAYTDQSVRDAIGCVEYCHRHTTCAVRYDRVQ
jgi:hypothetical protein